MAKRIIRTGIGSYVDTKGLNQFGFLGEEVDVHDDDIERFDRLNPDEAPIEEVDVHDDDSGEDLSGLSVGELKARAADLGIKLDAGAKKADIIAALNR